VTSLNTFPDPSSGVGVFVGSDVAWMRFRYDLVELVCDVLIIAKIVRG